jgi:hypothetical protein
MGSKIRNLKLSDGAMTSFKFADEEWKAIERVAEGRGMRWPEWARQLIDSNPSAPTRSGLLRRAALEEAFGIALLAERAELMQAGRELDHPMLTKRFWPLSGDALRAELERARITYRGDFQSFELIAAYREGKPVLILRNKLEDGLSVVLTQDPVIDESPDDTIFDRLADDRSVFDRLPNDPIIFDELLRDCDHPLTGR